MATLTAEKPLFVYRHMVLYRKFSTAVVITVAVFAYIFAIAYFANLAAFEVLSFLLSAFVIHRFLLYRAISKTKVEYYDEKLKVIWAEHAIPKIVIGAKVRYYSDLKIGSYIIPLSGKKNAIYEKGEKGKLVTVIPKTKKRKELGGLTLLEWLNTKVNPSTENMH